jgi:hypothetical protein
MSRLDRFLKLEKERPGQAAPAVPSASTARFGETARQPEARVDESPTTEAARPQRAMESSQTPTREAVDRSAVEDGGEPRMQPARRPAVPDLTGLTPAEVEARRQVLLEARQMLSEADTFLRSVERVSGPFLRLCRFLAGGLMLAAVLGVAWLFGTLRLHWAVVLFFVVYAAIVMTLPRFRWRRRFRITLPGRQGQGSGHRDRD